jgi:two-component system sensor histidine kinase KdpD
VNSKRIIAVARWVASGLTLAAIVAFYRLGFHANQTTVALTFLLLILFLAANWGLRYAVVTSVAATLCYNFFFLPPIDTFTISDPENLLALLVFLITAIFASRSSDRIREESREARNRQSELEVLYRLSRALLQTDELVQLTNSIPISVSLATGARAVLFYLLEGDRIYRSGAEWPTQLGTAELKEISHAPGPTSSTGEAESIIPLRTGVKPRGVLIVRGIQLSLQTLDALGGLVSVSLDRAQAVEEVTRAEAGKESERLRGLMLDSITHELRTPLTSIKGAVSTLLSLDGQLPRDATTELLTIIDEESDRLNRLVAQAVEMAQLDTQEVRMTFSAQNVLDLVDDAIRETHPLPGGHEVLVRLPADLPKVEADPVWIQKLLGNLLENAAKYSGAGEPIFVTAERRGGDVAISVADRGLGIDPMEQSLIFDKFYRARNRSQGTSGTGMGLAICRAIAETHGGSISVTSQMGHGSVFTFTLRTSGREQRS